MRRQARTLIFIACLVTLSALILANKTFSIGNVERGGDALFGLELGLDLQGGSHLVYQAVDMDTGDAIIPELGDMDSLKRSIEERVNASGLGQPNIQVLGENRLLIQLPGVRDLDRAKALIGETAQLVFKHRRVNVPRNLNDLLGSDILGSTIHSSEMYQTKTEVLEGTLTSETSTETEEVQDDGSEENPQGSPVLVVEFTETGAEKFAEILGRLIESLSIDADTLELIETDNIFANFLTVSIKPGMAATDVVVEAGEDIIPLQTTAFLIAQLPDGRSVPVPSVPLIERIEDGNSFMFDLGTIVTDLDSALEMFGDAPEVVFDEEIQGKVDEDIGLTGDDLIRAFASQHAQGGLPIVNIEFNERGTRIFGELTKRIAGTPDQIAIFLDEEELISPVVSTAITTGTAIIQGRNFTLERVKDLALLLEAGSLPLTIDLVQERSVDAMLGADSLRKSVVAGIVGLLLVLLFMTLYYRIPGVIASVTLLIYAMLVMALFKLLPVTLELSGVAATILSIGMAVDANILIFERMKDELRMGRTLMSAINIGFNRAWPAIRDGNVSTLITCGILFWFSDRLGETIVQSFAATLAIGVLISMFSAIVVSRTLLRVIAVSKLSKKLHLFVPFGGSDLPQSQISNNPAKRS